MVSAPKLHRALVGIFPELADTRVSHSWVGFVAYTFDTLMHIGAHKGLYYAMGYCGSGVGMAGYLGMKIGKQVLGQDQADTGFHHVPFPHTAALYRASHGFWLHQYFTIGGGTRLNI